MILPSAMPKKSGKNQGFTLAEVLISTMLSVMTMSAIVYGYLTTATRAEWTSYSLAAESYAMQRVEQVRSCKWDLGAVPEVDELQTTNFTQQTNIMDIPINGTNVVWCTNFTVISQVLSNPPVKCVRVDCTWTWPRSRRVFTNTVVTYRSPDSF
ncbi:MAG: hypothetical protein WCO56_14565 [Verrucomicrobiota bacterium]